MAIRLFQAAGITAKDVDVGQFLPDRLPGGELAVVELGVQELDEQSRTLRFVLNFNRQTIDLAREGFGSGICPALWRKRPKLTAWRKPRIYSVLRIFSLEPVAMTSRI